MRNKLKLLQKGFEYIRRGEIHPVLQHVGSKIEEYADPNSGVHVRLASGSPALRNSRDFAWARADTNGSTSFFNITTANSIHVDPGYSFSWFAVDLVDVRNVETATVNATFYDSDGKTVDNASTTFTNGHFYDRPVMTFEFAAECEAVEATVELQQNNNRSNIELEDEWQRNNVGPLLSQPRCENNEVGAPILLVSIDSLRYDHLEYLENTQEKLGSDLQIPSDPRSQAPATAPSHGSIFTGLYPGEHGCQHPPHQLSESVTTLAEMLQAEGYRCSSCYGNYYLSADTELSRGFHRSKFNPMDWKAREYDAKENVDDTIEWLSRDVKTNPNKLFYFLHIQDPHYPYFPPQHPPNVDEIDYPSMRRLIDQYYDQREQTYVGAAQDRPNIDSRDTELARQYYRDSISYVDRQIARLVDAMKTNDVFEESLIIVLGDHGEEFGDDGFLFHWTLHDEVVRPAMLVKPPSSDGFDVPDAADFIDIVPTVADIIGAKIPSQVEGQSWKRDVEPGPRIAEEFATPEYYNISIEKDNRKVLLSYKNKGGARPTDEQITDGPDYKHSIDISRVRDGESRWDDASIPNDETEDLVRIAEEFISSRDGTISEGKSVIPKKVNERLRELGYVE